MLQCEVCHRDYPSVDYLGMISEVEAISDEQGLRIESDYTTVFTDVVSLDTLYWQFLPLPQAYALMGPPFP